MAGEAIDFLPDGAPVDEIAGVRLFTANRLAFAIGLDGTTILAEREPLEALRPAAHDGTQNFEIDRSDLDQLVDPVLGPTPQSASTGRSLKKLSIRSGAMTVSPSGFRHPEAILARNLFGATPAEAVKCVAS